MAHYGKFQNVRNNIAIVGTKNDQEKAVIKRGQKLLIIIAWGYGETQGVMHKIKSISELSRADEITGKTHLQIFCELIK